MDGSAALPTTQAIPQTQTSRELDAQKRIIEETGGLPLVIAIVGSTLKQDSGPLTTTCEGYLGWADEVKDIVLGQDPEYSGYLSSVWKAFKFAFEGVLRGNDFHRYTASLAHFIASCETASTLAEYVRLYSMFKKRRTGHAQPVTQPSHPAVDQLRFLDRPISTS
ncbi:hypothetical protein B0H63DRAFT_488839 [Podospora didyma]|uniref:Uncharacterized protein n=1 Tax=Podospora didyma TaxID=330526 RepID=A0AAE0K368_9PEZI|nr:hypothetical protein B0H63DRAFT_488839 [Podospora didyma]